MDDDERRRRVKERQDRIADTLIRAAEDPALRADVLADPQSLFGTRADNQPPLPQHVEDIRREIITHLLDRTANDGEFRALLREDLFKAIRTAGLTPQMERLRAELPVNAEVTGYSGWGTGWDDWAWGWGTGWGTGWGNRG